MSTTEQDRALVAVARAVSEGGGRDKILNYVAEHWPRLVGAEVADVLEHTVSYDQFLDLTEPFYEANGEALPDTPGVIYALHAAILLAPERRVPALGQVLAILAAAGLVPPGQARRARLAYDPIPDLAALLDGVSAVARSQPDGDEERRRVLGELLLGPYARLRGGLLLDDPGRYPSTEAAIRDALVAYITRGGRLMRDADFAELAAEAEQGYDLGKLRERVVAGGLPLRQPVPEHAEHTADGPPNCPRCRLLREHGAALEEAAARVEAGLRDGPVASPADPVELARHCLAVHKNLAAPDNDAQTNADLHHHDHFGPGGLRSHLYDDLSYDPAVLDEMLAEERGT